MYTSITSDKTSKDENAHFSQMGFSLTQPNASSSYSNERRGRKRQLEPGRFLGVRRQPGMIDNLQPITLALVYIGTILKDLSDVTHGWSDRSSASWLDNYHDELEEMKNMSRQEYVAYLRRVAENDVFKEDWRARNIVNVF